MREGEANMVAMLQRLQIRDVEISVLLQRASLLLEVPARKALTADPSATRHVVGNVDHGLVAAARGGMLVPSEVSTSSAEGPAESPFPPAGHELRPPSGEETGTQEALKKRLALLCHSQRQVRVAEQECNILCHGHIYTLHVKRGNFRSHTHEISNCCRVRYPSLLLYGPSIVVCSCLGVKRGGYVQCFVLIGAVKERHHTAAPRCAAYLFGVLRHTGVRSRC